MLVINKGREFGKNEKLKFSTPFKTRRIWKINEYEIKKCSWWDKKQDGTGNEIKRKYLSWLKKSRNKNIAART